jgi:uracil-DNA glycosylase
MPSQCKITAWNEIQGRIWCCNLCCGRKRVACNIRQRTEVPSQPVKLMLVGVAPPYVKDVATRTLAKSATNDANDNLRSFIVAALGGPWDDLFARGLLLIHSVKCAIVPKDGHQNPPDDVVDVCVPPHLAHEIQLTRPAVVVVFGKAPYRALLTVPGVRPSMPSALGLSCSVTTLVDETRGGKDINADGWLFRLFGSPFPLRERGSAAEILKKAARYAEVVR